MKRVFAAVVLSALVAATGMAASEPPVGKWKTVDEKSGKAISEVELYQQDGKLFGLGG